MKKNLNVVFFNINDEILVWFKRFTSTQPVEKKRKKFVTELIRVVIEFFRDAKIKLEFTHFKLS